MRFTLRNKSKLIKAFGEDYNRIKDYIEANKDNLFFDETNDPQLVKVRKKLERARKNVANAEARLRTKVEQKIAGK